MKRILIVEDDALLNKTLAYNLISDGWDVTPALNARTAASLLAGRSYDLCCWTSICRMGTATTCAG